MLDFGVDELVEFSSATEFPWLLSNVIDNTTDRQLAEGKVTWIIEWNGRKVGCFKMFLDILLAAKSFTFISYSNDFMSGGDDEV